MIGYIKGKILSVSADTALIVTDGGVGYDVLCSGTAIDSLTGKKEGELYTYMHVTENGVALYGFSSQEEKRMFLKLISVSGVGPKIGIAVLSTLNVGEIATAIATSDIKRLSMVKGLGKKSAERIVLELREKVTAAEGVSGAAVPQVSGGDEDAVVALMSLGYSRAESERAISRAKSGGASSIEDIIMLAIKGM